MFRNVFAEAGATAVVAPADGSTSQRPGDVPVAYHLRYVHTDALGSPVLETNADGQEIDGTRTQYEPYGAPLPTPHDGSPSYTGHQYDTGTGLIYAQQRYYDPQLGVFYSPDPMAVDTTSAFNFNRYAYANNSPYKFTDPDGRVIVVPAIYVAVEAVAWASAAYMVADAAVSSVQGSGVTLQDVSIGSLILMNPTLAGAMNEATQPEGQATDEAESEAGAGVGADIVDGGRERSPAPALEGDPYSPQEVDRRRSRLREDLGTSSRDPDSPIPDQGPGRDMGGHEARGRTPHSTGERNVNSKEEHSRRAKGNPSSQW